MGSTKQIKSIFRYPGAKGKLIEKLATELGLLLDGQDSFCDAFLGGGSVLLYIAQTYPNIKLYANDLYADLAAYWSLIGSGSKLQLDQLIGLLDIVPTVELFYQLKEEDYNDIVNRAFRCIIFNRCSFSGLGVNPIGGKQQLSKYKVNCRYNYKKISATIINTYYLLNGRLEISNVDFSNYNILLENNIPIYCDPPYYIKGKELYNNFMNEEQHKQLAQILNDRKKWLLSYDNNDIIKELYKNCEIQDFSVRYSVNGTKTSWANNTELLIKSK